MLDSIIVTADSHYSFAKTKALDEVGLGGAVSRFLEEIRGWGSGEPLTGTKIAIRLKKSIGGEKRIREAIQVLERAKLIDRPRGVRSGYRITKKGEAFGNDDTD